jgi:hypothetical protein
MQCAMRGPKVSALRCQKYRNRHSGRLQGSLADAARGSCGRDYFPFNVRHFVYLFVGPTAPHLPVGRVPKFDTLYSQEYIVIER